MQNSYRPEKKCFHCKYYIYKTSCCKVLRKQVKTTDYCDYFEGLIF